MYMKYVENVPSANPWFWLRAEQGLGDNSVVHTYLACLRPQPHPSTGTAKIKGGAGWAGDMGSEQSMGIVKNTIKRKKIKAFVF